MCECFRDLLNQLRRVLGSNSNTSAAFLAMTDQFQFAEGSAGEVRQLRIADALVYFGSGRFEDERGFYEEVEQKASEEPTALQTGYAISKRNVMRGLHCSPYGKIVVCQAGGMWDVLVDLRPTSRTFMAWDYVVLSPTRRSRVYVPPGVGHGYLALEDNTVTLYLKLGRYEKSREIEVNALDKSLGIAWPPPLDGASDYIMSVKDRSNPLAADVLRGLQNTSRL
ncbi:unnamed protein product [Polarella glacialis]|uniref:dTDP-4-dehydrorhamnose 3,5-epimerase n=1 Tax=Polarella glacialis TaxID=89957 RepID=A0A813H1X8_POLGL|nr:unnamed protein product [Polarella glacialis]